MIAKEHLGKKINTIETEFEVGFNNPALTDEMPAVVLASVNQIPNGANDWYLRMHTYGGFDVHTKYAAIKPLHVKPPMRTFLLEVVNELFIESEDGLDHGVNEQAVSAYEDFITNKGLTYTAQKSGVLSQALYPIDATKENLALLTDENIDLNQLKESDLVIYIVGENCY